ncbi:MAG: hypothetical protein KAX78_11450 [Phycisphaerae bacterium]|nr:hypothetical protein [Phycisphaerae bacterium]
MVAQTRGRNVATWGAGLQTVFTGVMVTVWLWTGAVSALPAALFLGGGVLVWLEMLTGMLAETLLSAVF